MIQLSNEDALLVKKALEKELAYETTFLISTSRLVLIRNVVS